MLKHQEVNGSLQGHKICANGPIISHLLFADDSIFFCKATVEQADLIVHILRYYGEALGQKININKSSVVFGKGLGEARRKFVTIVDIREVLSQGKYLGLPSHIGRSKNRAFIYFER